MSQALFLGSAGAAFAAGLVAFFAPCCAAVMVPSYLARSAREAVGASDASQLQARDLTLVSVTTDPPDVLRQAVMQYGITTPMISDATREMSMAYGANGQGMHANTDGHTFLLIDATGHIRWRHDYTTMYVPPAQLLAAIPQI